MKSVSCRASPSAFRFFGVVSSESVRSTTTVSLGIGSTGFKTSSAIVPICQEG